MDRIFILDRSGSMETALDDTIGGFNAFVNEQREYGGTLTLVQFDHEYMISYDHKPIGEVEPLTRQTFQPRGATALFDAIGKAIKNVQTGTPIVIIFTDGHENASREYTRAHVKDLIDQKTKDGWTFVYLGANQDAFDVGAGIGIGANQTMNYETTRTPDAFTRLSNAMSARATGQTQTVELGP